MKTSELAKMLARELRRNQTVAEKLFWGKIRNRKFIGFKFTRQHPVYYFKNDIKKFFIADFFCNELKLVIELDGKIHLKQKDYDIAREELLKAKNLHILRFTNTEINNDINACLKEIIDFAKHEFPSLLNQRRARDE